MARFLAVTMGRTCYGNLDAVKYVTRPTCYRNLEARDAVKYVTRHRRAPTTKNYPAPSVSTAKADNPLSRRNNRRTAS